MVGGPEKFNNFDNGETRKEAEIKKLWKQVGEEEERELIQERLDNLENDTRNSVLEVVGVLEDYARFAKGEKETDTAIVSDVDEKMEELIFNKYMGEEGGEEGWRKVRYLLFMIEKMLSPKAKKLFDEATQRRVIKIPKDQ